jgi:multidrug resistance efflux pump
MPNASVAIFLQIGSLPVITTDTTFVRCHFYHQTTVPNKNQKELPNQVSGAKPKLLRPIKSKAQLDAAKLNLTYTAVTAAIDGQVQN